MTGITKAHQDQRTDSSSTNPLPGCQPRMLRDSVELAMTNYFAHLEGQDVTDVYNMVLSEVEAPLLECVIRHAQGNKTQAAVILGLSRGTLRKKLRQYGLE